MVKCCRTYEEVYEGDVGKVIKLDRDGLHDLNVQCDWQQKGGTYWVRYIHIELLGKLQMMVVLENRGTMSAPHSLTCVGTFFFRVPTSEFSLPHKDWRQSESEALSHHAKVQMGLSHPQECGGCER